MNFHEPGAICLIISHKSSWCSERDFENKSKRALSLLNGRP